MLRRGLIEGALLLAGLGVFAAALYPETVTAGTAPPPAAPSVEVIARYDAAVAKVAAGDDPVAVAELTALTRDHPEYSGPFLNLGMIRAREGHDEEAMVLFQQAAAVCDHCAPVWNELGVLQRRQGRFTESEQAYRKAIEADPGYALPYYNLAVLCELYSQRPDLAVDYYQRYLDLKPDADAAPEVAKWVADLKRRVAPTAGTTTARTEGAP